MTVWVYPDYYDGNEADWYEEDVDAEQQAVYDETHLPPILWALAATQLLLHLEADGLEVPAQASQLPKGLALRCRILISFLQCHHSAQFHVWFERKQRLNS